ncbi:MAG: GxxExxY protein [Chloroflexi bacterium]|nr:MAG: GxxExxY protein [Chloroflexota bacterium]
MSYKYSDLTGEILGAFYDVYNDLGYGFLEKVYENALAIELRVRGFIVDQQKPIHVHYRKQVIGEYFADLIVNDLIILELKAARSIGKKHEAQLLNYLKATKYEVGLLLNFGPLPKQVRKAFDNHNKPHLFTETIS